MRNYIFWLLLIISLLTGCMNSDQYQAQNHSINKNETAIKETEGEFIASLKQEVTIAAVGDLLIHSTVYNDAWNGERYNFIPMLEPISQYLKSPTITMANQETIMGGEKIGLSTYPQFNSPFELGDDLKELGVDLVTMANNHTLDRGEQAIRNAINHYEKIGMDYTGSFKSEEDKKRIRVINTDEGISIAFLSYTYGTNGMTIPPGKEYLVNLINRTQIKADVAKAQDMADAIIVSYHFGEEYQPLPNQQQKELVQYSADLGVDVIIGHHPHVLQPIEWVEGKNGNQTLVAYSLGNFVSGQYELYQRTGGIFEFKISKESKDKTKITVHSPDFLPTFVSFERSGESLKNVAVVPLKEIDTQQLPNRSSYLEEIRQHLSQNIEDLEFIE